MEKATFAESWALTRDKLLFRSTMRSSNNYTRGAVWHVLSVSTSLPGSVA